jgi:hypothetical protein
MADDFTLSQLDTLTAEQLYILRGDLSGMMNGTPEMSLSSATSCSPFLCCRFRRATRSGSEREPPRTDAITSASLNIRMSPPHAVAVTPCQLRTLPACEGNSPRAHRIDFDRKDLEGGTHYYDYRATDDASAYTDQAVDSVAPRRPVAHPWGQPMVCARARVADSCTGLEHRPCPLPFLGGHLPHVPPQPGPIVAKRAGRTDTLEINSVSAPYYPERFLRWAPPPSPSADPMRGVLIHGSLDSERRKPSSSIRAAGGYEPESC